MRAEKIKMWWSDQYYYGIIVDTETLSDDEDDIPISSMIEKDITQDVLIAEAMYDSDDDVPLSHLISSEDNARLATLRNVPIEDTIIEAELPFPDIPSEGAAQPLHLNENHTSFPSHERAPEDFVVDGAAREDPRPVSASINETARALIKRCRTQGLSYTTEKNKVQKLKKEVKSRCSSESVCTTRQLGCGEISEDRRLAIFKAFYGLGSLHEQRQWMKEHITQRRPIYYRVSNSRKERSINYFLPNENGECVRICRTLFKNTIDVCDWQIRSVLDKTNTEGVLEEEKRGGRVESQQIRDQAIKTHIRLHINRFHRTESHY